MHDFFSFLLLKEGILNIPGNKLIKNGKIKEIPKLIKEFFIK